MRGQPGVDPEQFRRATLTRPQEVTDATAYLKLPVEDTDPAKRMQARAVMLRWAVRCEPAMDWPLDLVFQTLADVCDVLGTKQGTTKPNAR